MVQLQFLYKVGKDILAIEEKGCLKILKAAKAVYGMFKKQIENSNVKRTSHLKKIT